MPSVMYLKCLKITATGADSQGKFDYAVCDDTRVPKITGKGDQMTYSQRILPSFLRRGIVSPAIGSKRSFIQHSALAANP